MIWEISVNYDADQADVGSVTGTWTDPVYGIFTYSQRIKANLAGANAFIAAAILARNTWQVKQQANIAGAAFVLGKINTADPRAGG